MNYNFNYFIKKKKKNVELQIIESSGTSVFFYKPYFFKGYLNLCTRIVTIATPPPHPSNPLGSSLDPSVESTILKYSYL